MAWQSEVGIRLGLEHAFHFVADARNEPMWHLDLDYCHQDNGDGPGLGASYRYERVTPIGTVEGRKTCTRFEPPGLLEWRVGEGRQASRVRLELHPHQDGLRLRKWVRAEVRGMRRWLLRLRRGRLVQELQTDLLSLKQLLESTSYTGDASAADSLHND